MKHFSLVFLLLAVLVLGGAGCGAQQEEPEEPQTEDQSEEHGLYNEAEIEALEGYERHLPGFWTFTIVAAQGQLDANLVIYDDGTAQGLFGTASTPQTGSQRVNYDSDSYGTWEMVGESTVRFAGGSIQPFNGTILSETSMSGSLIDTSGTSYNWTATKTDELDRLLEIKGEWMLNFTVNGQERFEEIHCAANGLCEVVWEKYPGLYEGPPSEPRFYTYHHQGGYNFQLESTDGSLSHDLTATWQDYWGGWEAEGSATNNNNGSTDNSYGVKMSE